MTGDAVDKDLEALTEAHLAEDVDDNTTVCLCGWKAVGTFWERARAQTEHHFDVSVQRWGFAALKQNDDFDGEPS